MHSIHMIILYLKKKIKVFGTMEVPKLSKGFRAQCSIIGCNDGFVAQVYHSHAVAAISGNKIDVAYLKPATVTLKLQAV